jgi:acyl carrier protein
MWLCFRPCHLHLMGRSATAVQVLANRYRCERRTQPSDPGLSDTGWWRLAGLDDADRLAVLTRIVVTSVARALGTDRDTLDPDHPLDTLGLDSLLLVGILTEVNVMLGTDLSFTDLLGADSIREIAIDLDQQVHDELLAAARR